MIYHVLPGDAIVAAFESLQLDGELIVCRECLVDGDLDGESVEDFWNTRADFISSVNGGDRGGYFTTIANELKKLESVSETDEVNLWFEYELFCQVNYWFCLSLLRGSESSVFRVHPSVRHDSVRWNGFGGLESNELSECWSGRVKLSAEDLFAGEKLWEAYRIRDHQNLRELALNRSPAFPSLPDACEAASNQHIRPRQIIEEIRGEGHTEFNDIFSEFSARAGEYGFGDAQVKRILGNLKV